MPQKREGSKEYKHPQDEYGRNRKALKMYKWIFLASLSIMIISVILRIGFGIESWPIMACLTVAGITIIILVATYSI